jgi:hypothetical protein
VERDLPGRQQSRLGCCGGRMPCGKPPVLAPVPRTGVRTEALWCAGRWMSTVFRVTARLDAKSAAAAVTPAPAGAEASTVVFECGKLAQLADGSATVQVGERRRERGGGRPRFAQGCEHATHAREKGSGGSVDEDYPRCQKLCGAVAVDIIWHRCP